MIKNRLIQFKSSSSFNSLLQNIPFYHSTTTPLKPYLGKEHAQFPTVLHYTTARKYGRKAEKQKYCTQQNEIYDVVGFLLFFFCSFFKQQVSEHTRLFSDGHEEHFNGFSTALS